MTTTDAFRAHLERLNLGQREYAALIGRHERTVRRWATGKWPVPRSVMEALERSDEDDVIVPPEPEPVTEGD